LTPMSAEQVGVQQSAGLLGNPFELLAVSLNATPENIGAAFDDALFDGVVAAEELREARRQLLAPKLRLTAEISFLPDATEKGRLEALEALRRNAPFSDLMAIARDLAPVSRENFLAHLGALEPSSDILREFALAQAAIVLAETHKIIVALHREATVPEATQEAVNEALNAASETNTALLFAAYREPKDAAKDLGQCLEENLANASPELVNAYTSMTNAYNSSVSSIMQAFRRQIKELSEQLRAEPDGTSIVAALQEQLEKWDELAQPLQVLAFHKGRDESKSRDLFEFVRGLSIELANERDAVGAALEISRVCATVFAELPRAARQLEDDIKALEELADQVGAKQLLHFVDDMRKDLNPLVYALDTSGFGKTSSGKARRLYVLFNDAVLATEGNSAANLPWIAVRGLAIDINNELGESAAGAAIIRGLRTHPRFPQSPADIKKQILNDLKMVSNNVLQTKFTKAINAKDHAGTRRALDELANNAEDAGERREYQQAIAAIDSARQRKYVKYGIWAAIVIGIIAVASNQGGQRSGYSRSTYTPSVSSPRPNPPVTSAPSIGSFKPRVGTDLVFSRENLRYCLYLNARLDAVDAALVSETEDSVIAAFNMEIDDYNSRCASFRYRSSDMSIIESEVAAKRSALKVEGLQMLQNWRTAN